MRRLIVTVAAFAVAAALASAAVAATATPFGGATTSGGVLTLVSNTSDAGSANDASGATFFETGVTTFASITTLSAEFDVTDDDCKAGSPRFQVRVQTPSGEKNVFVYLGPAPSFTGCSTGVWIASGNLIGSPDSRFDTSQVQSGTQASTHAQALGVVGSFQVTAIAIVVDSSFAFDDKEQTVKVRNVKVNDATFFRPEAPRPPAGGVTSNPAKACLKARAEMRADAFRAFFGTNRNGANAFGKCVSWMARFRTVEALEAAVGRLDAAAERCTERAVAGRGKAKGHAKAKGKGHGKAKAKRHSKHDSLRACLERVA
jgi:hypothetical protein